jgi:hypothetical protein
MPARSNGRPSSNTKSKSDIHPDVMARVIGRYQRLPRRPRLMRNRTINLSVIIIHPQTTSPFAGLPANSVSGLLSVAAHLYIAPIENILAPLEGFDDEATDHNREDRKHDQNIHCGIPMVKIGCAYSKRFPTTILSSAGKRSTESNNSHRQWSQRGLELSIFGIQLGRSLISVMSERVHATRSKAAVCLSRVRRRNLCAGEYRGVVSNRKALSFRSHQLARIPPQTEHIACPGDPTAVSDSATWYLAAQPEQVIPYILMTSSQAILDSAWKRLGNRSRRMNFLQVNVQAKCLRAGQGRTFAVQKNGVREEIFGQM